MEYAIFLNSVLPVRAEAKESSEMVTQLLFGDFCRITGRENSFCKIENHYDGYTGWADEKMLSKIDENTFGKLAASPVFRTNVPTADAFCRSDKGIYRLSAGSSLPLYNHETSTFGVAGKDFQIHPSLVTYVSESSKENVLPTAGLFLNTPYLWGGKNIFGIDCSGFVQVVHSLSGIWLPRDAREQVKEGVAIQTLPEGGPGDLLFFEKNNKITHVGIYMGEDKIIHSSGKVRIDKIDERGIYNEETATYTHQLAAIRKI